MFYRLRVRVASRPLPTWAYDQADMLQVPKYSEMVLLPLYLPSIPYV